MRKGAPSILVPNVLDFENPPPTAGRLCRRLPPAIGAWSPTTSCSCSRRGSCPARASSTPSPWSRSCKNPKCKLVVSHESGDEGLEYMRRCRSWPSRRGSICGSCTRHVGERRGTDEHGRKLYTLGDVYAQADLITYPSLYEGFGNALLEAFYYPQAGAGQPLLDLHHRHRAQGVPVRHHGRAS